MQTHNTNAVEVEHKVLIDTAGNKARIFSGIVTNTKSFN